MSELLYPHQTFTDYSLWYVNMPNVTADYGRFSVLIVFLGIFTYYNMFLKRYNFIKLLQIVC